MIRGWNDVAEDDGAASDRRSPSPINDQRELKWVWCGRVNDLGHLSAALLGIQFWRDCEDYADLLWCDHYLGRSIFVLVAFLSLCELITR